jgi:hypothetical protein
MARTGKVKAGKIKASVLRRDAQSSNGRWPDMSTKHRASDKPP